MKKLLYLLSIGGLLLVVTGCEEFLRNLLDNDDTTIVNQRIKTITYYNNQDTLASYQEEFFYASDKVNRVTVAFPNAANHMVLQHDVTISYQSDTVSIIWNNSAGVPNNMYERIYENELLKQEVEYWFRNHVWEPETKLMFTYNNDRMVKQENYEYQGGNFKKDNEETYTYDGDRLIRYTRFSDDTGTMLETSKIEITYENDKIKQLETYFKDQTGVWYLSNKTEFTYTENLVTLSRQMHLDLANTQQWITDYITSYTYTADDLLKETKVDYSSGSYFSLTRYAYEEGTGNAADLWLLPANMLLGSPHFQ